MRGALSGFWGKAARHLVSLLRSLDWFLSDVAINVPLLRSLTRLASAHGAAPLSFVLKNRVTAFWCVG